MEALVPIGEFARLTHLTVKTLRHYHDVGVLVPADVDAASGYRRYRLDQIDDAQLAERSTARTTPSERPTSSAPPMRTTTPRS